MERTDVEEHLRLWLRAGLTACDFAKRLAGRANGLAVVAHLESALPQSSWLADTFDANADADRAVLVALPRIISEQGLVEFLNALARDRWRVKRRRKASPGGGVLVGVDWITKNGEVSETMGFAPFYTMPVSRRAPYVAIATWPGGRSNPFRGQGSTPPPRDGVVSFLDAPHGYDLATYEKKWVDTTTRVASLMEVPPDNAAIYRNAAFVVSLAAAADLKSDA